MVRASTSALEDGRVDEHDLAVSAAQSITAVIEAPHHLPPSVVDRQLLPTALAALEEAPLTPIDEGAASAEWLHCLLCLLRSRRLAVATLTSQVLPWALSRGEVSSPVGHRLLCTYVIGALAEANPDSGWIEARFLSQVAHHQASQEAFIARLELRPSPIPSGPLAPMPGWWHTRSHTSNTLDRCRAVLTKCSCPPPPSVAQALAMCQDTELAVRCSMCEQLPLLAAALGPELASAGPLSEALEVHHVPGRSPPAFPKGVLMCRLSQCVNRFGG